MARFEVMAGTHSEGGRLYRTNEVFDTRVRVDKLFPASGKFAKTDKPVTPKAESNMLEEGDEEEHEGGDLGTDVTDQFTDAGDLDLTVYKHGRHYHVTEKGEKEILNKEEMTNKTQVNEFIAGYKR